MFQALKAGHGWWVAFMLYEDVQEMPATGGHVLPATGKEPLRTGAFTVAGTYIFLDKAHCEEWIATFKECHPDVVLLWEHIKPLPLRWDQVEPVLLKFGIVPVQVRGWAPELFKRYREGHAGMLGDKHGPAWQFAVSQAIDDAAQMARRRN